GVPDFRSKLRLQLLEKAAVEGGIISRNFRYPAARCRSAEAGILTEESGPIHEPVDTAILHGPTDGPMTGIIGLFQRAQPAGLGNAMILQEGDDPAPGALDSPGSKGWDGRTSFHRYHLDFRKPAAERGPGLLAAAIQDQDFRAGRPFLGEERLEALG